MLTYMVWRPVFFFIDSQRAFVKDELKLLTLKALYEELFCSLIICSIIINGFVQSFKHKEPHIISETEWEESMSILHQEF